MVATPFHKITNETWIEGDLITWHGGELTILICFLVICIFGNSLVLHIYAFRIPSSTVTLTKRMLAILDLGAVVISYPLYLYMLFNPESPLFKGMCAFTCFFAFWTTGCADLVLVVIAVDRFRRLCLLNNNGVEAQLTKTLFVAILISIGLIDIPCFWMFGKSTLYIPEYGVTVTGCFVRTDLLKRPVYYVYFIVLLIFVLVTSFTLFFLYFNIIQRFRHHRSVRDALFESSLIPQSEIRGYASTRDAMKNSIVVFAIITIVYFVCNIIFLIYISCYLLRSGLPHATTPKLKAVHDLIRHAPMFIHLINPVIYSFTSSVFREEVRRLLLCKDVDG